MKTENSKLILGLVVGAAIGASVCYLMNKQNRENLLEKINDSVDIAKKKISQAIAHGIEELDCAVDKVNTLAQNAAERMNATDVETEDR